MKFCKAVERLGDASKKGMINHASGTHTNGKRRENEEKRQERRGKQYKKKKKKRKQIEFGGSPVLSFVVFFLRSREAIAEPPAVVHVEAAAVLGPVAHVNIGV